MEHQKSQNTKSSTEGLSNAEVARSRQEWVDELVSGCSSENDLFGPDGAFTKLKASVMQRLLEGEMRHHLGYDKHAVEGRNLGNSRNGHSRKVVLTESGPVPVDVPRDRQGTFEPKLVGKHQRRLVGFDQKVIALYARGMTTRDIQAHLAELYGTEVSPDLISSITQSVLEEFTTWRSRPLESVYPIVYVDALFVPVREGGHVHKRPFYIALGVQLDGQRDVLGIWSAESEGAKYWLSNLSELKNRGLSDIFILCADGLTGLPQAVQTAFPNTVMQTCIVHMIRNSMRYVSWADRKKLAAALKPIYTAPSEQAAQEALDTFEKDHGKAHPAVLRSWRARWPEIAPFLAYPAPIRSILYTTNAIESLNSQFRKTLRHRGVFPTEDSVFKLLFLTIKGSRRNWSPPKCWYQALAHFRIVFQDRFPA